MNREVLELIEQIAGMPCSRLEVGRMKSLSLGFGQEVRSAIKINEKVYREWEIGTYRSAWRLVRAGLVLCGSQDVVNSIDEMNRTLMQFDLGRFISLQQVSELDIRIKFDSGIAVDFLATTSDDDESLHIFCPSGRFIEFSVQGGWKIGSVPKSLEDGPAV
jgi:hypothetical protein